MKNNYIFGKTNPNYRYRNRKVEDLTYILGARCSDGVVLVGDRVGLRGTIPSKKDKLLKILSNVIIGGAGASGIFERFSGEIVSMVNSGDIKSDADLLSFVEDRSLQLYQRYSLRAGRMEVLIAIRAGAKSQLFNLVTENGVAEPITGEPLAIGTGEPYGSLLLKKLWKKDIKMMEFAKLGYFLIKYVEKFELDKSVGGEPQIWFMPDITTQVSSEEEANKKFPIRLVNKKEMEEMEIFTENKLEEIKNFIEELKTEKTTQKVSK